MPKMLSPFVVALYGPEKTRALVDMPRKQAEDLFDGKLHDKGDPRLIEAVEGELADLANRDTKLAAGTLAMAAVLIAQQLTAPGNSATAKANLMKELREILATLRELAPAERVRDGLDAIIDAATQLRDAA
jgi:hypothetical protein